MFFGDFRVHIQELPGSMLYRVFLFQHRQGVTTFIKNDGTAQDVEEGVARDDNKLYFAEMSPDQLQAFAEALSNKGIKTNKDSVAEGKLQATERHLEDMRLIALKKFRE